MTPRTERLLHDLVEHAAAAARLVDRGRPAYDADEMLRYAAEDLLIRLGETVARIDRDDDRFVGAHPGLELRASRTHATSSPTGTTSWTPPSSGRSSSTTCPPSPSGCGGCSTVPPDRAPVGPPRPGCRP